MDCFVGSSTGAFKAINFQNSTFSNVTPSNSLVPKEHEITAMCFSDQEQTEILAAQINRQLKLYNTVQGTYSELFQIKDGEGSIKNLAMTKNSNIITAVESGEIRIWDNQGTVVGQSITAGKQLRVMTKNPNEEVIATGGLENELKVWDLSEAKTTFEAKNVRPDFLELRVPVNVANIRFLTEKLIVTTTGTHHIRIYDPRAQRRPIKEHEWLDEPINALSLCHRPEHIIAGNTRGDMSLFDLRSKINPIHKYRGFAGAIRSISAHPTKPIVASCGVDRFVRVHDVNSKKLLKKIYCKVQMNCILLSENNSIAYPPAKSKLIKKGSEEDEDQSEGEEAANSEEETLWKEMKTIGARKRKHDE